MSYSITLARKILTLPDGHARGGRRGVSPPVEPAVPATPTGGLTRAARSVDFF